MWYTYKALFLHPTTLTCTGPVLFYSCEVYDENDQNDAVVGHDGVGARRV